MEHRRSQGGDTAGAHLLHHRQRGLAHALHRHGGEPEGEHGAHQQAGKHLGRVLGGEGETRLGEERVSRVLVLQTRAADPPSQPLAPIRQIQCARDPSRVHTPQPPATPKPHLGVQDGRVDQVDLGAGDVGAKQRKRHQGGGADGKALANGGGGVAGGVQGVCV